MVVQWRDPEVQSKKRREAEALERQQGMECDDDKDNNKVRGFLIPCETGLALGSCVAPLESCSWGTCRCHLAATWCLEQCAA